MDSNSRMIPRMKSYNAKYFHVCIVLVSFGFLLAIQESEAFLHTSSRISIHNIPYHTSLPLFQKIHHDYYYYYYYSSSRTERRMVSNPSENPPPTMKPKKKKKKNKYAQFSKTDELEVDPLESLIQKSEADLKQMEMEQDQKKNGSNNKKIKSEEGQTGEKRERNKFQFPDNRDIDPYDPTTYGYTELGTIVGAHGVHGLVKVAAVTEFQDRLCKPGLRHIKAINRRSPREIRLMEGRHRLHDEYLVKLEGIGDRDTAKQLRGSVLYARQEERPDQIQKDEYLITELVGCEVFLITGYGEDVADDDNDDDNSNELIENNDNKEEAEEEMTATNKNKNNDNNQFVGTVGALVLADDMCTTAGIGQDLLELVLPRGPIPSWKDQMVLIPFVPQLVPIVDIERKIIYIDPPPGLMDLTYVKEEKVRIKGFLPEKSSYHKLN